MIIIFDKPNQLCNRIWSQAPIIARSLASKERVKVPFFGIYAPLFENLYSIDHINFSSKKSKYYLRFLRTTYKILRAVPKVILNSFNIYFLTNSEKIDWKKEKKLVFASSWDNTEISTVLMEKHKTLVKIYAPKNEYKKKVDDFFLNLKINYQIIIGVHIRRGDYRNYKAGIFYFENDTYLKYMHQLKQADEFKGKKLVFYISSNESIEEKEFEPLKVVRIISANPIEDIYALSLCDYIIGPPSTFSQWASFYGQKPLHFIDGSVSLNIANFSPIISQNYFANGAQLKNQKIVQL